MARYDRSYDFGLRGYPQTTRALGRGRPRRPSYDQSAYISYPGSGPDYPLPNRVTASYNRDYVDGARSYDRTFGFSGGDRFDRMGDEGYYRHPYFTVGGTRTLRGARGPQGFDPGRFGPTYGGRFPDEL